MNENLMVGIKFCGGCNPRYDRVKALENIKRQFSEIDFVLANEHDCYYILLVICGCKSACANIEPYKRNFTIIIDEARLLDHVLHQLMEKVRRQ